MSGISVARAIPPAGVEEILHPAGQGIIKHQGEGTAIFAAGTFRDGP
jgi:hypothetical protein